VINVEVSHIRAVSLYHFIIAVSVWKLLDSGTSLDTAQCVQCCSAWVDE